MPNKKNNNNSNNKSQSKQTAKSAPQSKVNVTEGVVAKVLKSLPKGSFAALGGLAGSAVGMPGIGAAIGSGISAITGMGDYTVQANTLASTGSASLGVPQFNVGSTHSVAHRECLGTLTATGSQAFQLNAQYRFNPSDTTTFPWLSSMAKNFQSYRVRGAVVVYESNTSEFSSSPYMGTICIGTKYDVNESPFSNMVEMQNAKFSVSAKPSQHLIHPIECARGFQPTDVFYIRNGTESTTAFNFDKCMIYVATEGITATVGQVLGRMWITYDIELINPILPTPSSSVFLNSARCASVGHSTSNRQPYEGLTTNLRQVAYTDSTGTYYTNPLVQGAAVIVADAATFPQRVGKYTAASVQASTFPNACPFRLYRTGTYIWQVDTTATSGLDIPSISPAISGIPSGAAAVGVFSNVINGITEDSWSYIVTVTGLCGGGTFSDKDRYLTVSVPIDQDINAVSPIKLSYFHYLPDYVDTA